MRLIVLCAWLVTATLGGHLATVWIRHGGLRQRTPGVTRLPLWLVLGHVALAVCGLAAWCAYVLGGVRSSAWAACAVVLIVAAFGFMMLLRWLPSSGRHSHAGGATAERHFPLAAVVAHGASAGATVLLVVLVVVGRA